MNKPRNGTSRTNKADKPAGAAAHPWLAHYPKDVSWDMRLTPGPLHQILEHSAERFGSRPCTYFQGKRLTYAQIAERACRAARGLQDMGVGKGTKVGLLLPNCPAYVVFYFAILNTGATLVNFNPLYTVEELEHQVSDSGTEVMVTLDLAALFDKTEALLASGVLDRAVICPFSDMLPVWKALFFRLFKSKMLARPDRSEHSAKVHSESVVLDNDGAFDAPEISPGEDIAVLQYTGGTTGTPKGAMLTHANLSANVQQVDAWVTNVGSTEDRFLGILPLFHVFAMTSVLNFGVSRGCEIILLPKFDVDELLEMIGKLKPSVFPGVPTIFNAILNHPKRERYDLSSLKFCISGGAGLPVEVKRGFETLSGCALMEGYGLSETSPVATCNPVGGETREGSIGLPLPATVISIRSIEDPDTEMPLSENGEICIAGPQVMKGYWDKPEETRDAFTGEFFRSGDIGYMAEDGYTYIVDRLKDMINASGFKIYPRQIEEAIYQHPAVEEVTVVGVPDDYRGEAPKAFIKLCAGKSATEEDILAFLESKISKIEMPREVEFRDELPQTMVGKPSKKELREEEQAG